MAWVQSLVWELRYCILAVKGKKVYKVYNPMVF